MRLVDDVTARVTFPALMPDGSIQMVVSKQTLRAGFEVKELTAAEAAAEQAALQAVMTKTKIEPAK